MKNWFILLLLISLFNNCYSQITIQGIVYDSITHEPLPFVNISVSASTNGTSASMTGKFNLTVNNLPAKILFSYVGYEKKEIVISENSYLKIELKNSGISLGEATVFAGPNPALLIMKKVIANSDRNNPEKNCRFQYTSYNKLLFTIEADSVKLTDKKNSNTLNKDDIETIEFIEKQHLFLMESVSEKKYASKNKTKETIIASKISGLNLPAFSLLGTQLQSIHFYHDEISLSETKYVGPVSNAGLRHYRFELKDTFYLNQDTVYSITFYPKNEKDIHSLKGVLQIHTDGYAIYNVKSEPCIPQKKGFGIHISQQYKKVDQQWFPFELKSKLIPYEVQIESFSVVGLAVGMMENIKINPEFTSKEFDEIEMSVDENINFISKNNLSQYRTDSLTYKEKETYRIVDSVGKAQNLDKKILVFESLFKGYVPIKFIDWDLTKLIAYNDYEGARIGLGLRTNHKISKLFSVGGYLAYGFTDKAWKYGADLNFIFSKRKQMEWNISFKQDVESSSVVNSFEKNRYLFAQGYSNFFQNRFDSVLKYESTFSFRTLKHFKVTLFGNYQSRDAYRNYQFIEPLSENISLLNESYHLAETGIEIKMALNEKFIETPFGYLSKGTKWPIVYLRYTRGLSGILQSQYDYNRLTLRANYTHSTLKAGTYIFGIAGGITSGKTPYHLLFSPSGTYKPIEKLSVYSMDGFETMRTNEFLASQFTSFHFQYRFTKPIINGKNFKPLISFTNAMTIGKFEDALNHRNLDFRALDKLYTESGIVIDNLYKSGISGIGIGFFYRWGNYQFPHFKDNFAIKISLALALS